MIDRNASCPLFCGSGMTTTCPFECIFSPVQCIQLSSFHATTLRMNASSQRQQPTGDNGMGKQVSPAKGTWQHIVVL